MIFDMQHAINTNSNNIFVRMGIFRKGVGVRENVELEPGWTTLLHNDEVEIVTRHPRTKTAIATQECAREIAACMGCKKGCNQQEIAEQECARDNATCMGCKKGCDAVKFRIRYRFVLSELELLRETKRKEEEHQVQASNKKEQEARLEEERKEIASQEKEQQARKEEERKEIERTEEMNREKKCKEEERKVKQRQEDAHNEEARKDKERKAEERKDDERRQGVRDNKQHLPHVIHCDFVIPHDYVGAIMGKDTQKKRKHGGGRLRT